jgi:PleD family two-component response regulator
MVIDAVPQEPGRSVSEDLVLAVSRYLRDRLRWVDTVARFEGARFMVLLPETRESEAWQLAGKLAATRSSLEMPAGTVDPGLDLRFAVTEWHKGDDPRVLRARAVSLMEVGKAA